MALKWDDGESLDNFIRENNNSLVNFDTDKIMTNNATVTICEMVRRIVDTLVLNEVDKKQPDMFDDLMKRIKYVYISSKKMQNRIVELNGSSDDLFEKIDVEYDISKRINRVKKLR
jgi:hypothetical protein